MNHSQAEGQAKGVTLTEFCKRHNWHLINLPSDTVMLEAADWARKNIGPRLVNWGRLYPAVLDETTMPAGGVSINAWLCVASPLGSCSFAFANESDAGKFSERWLPAENQDADLAGTGASDPHP